MNFLLFDLKSCILKTNFEGAHIHLSQQCSTILLGIITNYKDLKHFLEKKGYEFSSDTDTEVIAVLLKHLYKLHPHLGFRELVEQACFQLVSGFFRQGYLF